VSWLLDTNVISEIRKGTKGDPRVMAWATGRQDAAWISVLTIGELRRGVEQKRRKDEMAGRYLDVWLGGILALYESRILLVNEAVADLWGRLNVPNPVPTVDGLLAATALVHNLTLVTRNTRDVAATGVRVFNPFEP
jgi:predicted nucleic acid-binding protein